MGKEDAAVWECRVETIVKLSGRQVETCMCGRTSKVRMRKVGFEAVNPPTHTHTQNTPELQSSDWFH